jgi:hypothetical protein
MPSNGKPLEEEEEEIKNDAWYYHTIINLMAIKLFPNHFFPLLTLELSILLS